MTKPSRAEIIEQLISKTKQSECVRLKKKFDDYSDFNIEWMISDLNNNPDFRLTNFEYEDENTQIVVYMENVKTAEEKSITLLLSAPPTTLRRL